MAQVCVNGSRECTGCMNCYEQDEQIGVCEHCSDVIFDGETHYDINGMLLHWDCLREWASEFMVF